jgi:hypothetical protein
LLGARKLGIVTRMPGFPALAIHLSTIPAIEEFGQLELEPTLVTVGILVAQLEVVLGTTH